MESGRDRWVDGEWGGSGGGVKVMMVWGGVEGDIWVSVADARVFRRVECSRV